MMSTARKSLALAGTSLLLLQACATQQPPPPTLPDYAQLDSLMKGGECNPATAAMIGAALGAMIADDNRTKGAAIGAGLGALACYIINAQSKQTRPPADLEGQYRAENQGTLPEQPLVTEIGFVLGIQQGFTPGPWLVFQGRVKALRQIPNARPAHGVFSAKQKLGDSLISCDRHRYAAECTRGEWHWPDVGRD